MAFHQAQGKDLLLFCLIQPKSSKDEIVGLQDERLKIRIKAPPVDGKANAHLIRFLADTLDLPRARIEIASGDTGKRKTVRLLDSPALPTALQPFTETAS